MAASYVTLILDETDATGAPITRGSAGIAPSQRLPDPADSILIGQAPVLTAFSSSGPPSLRLVANDTIGPQQNGGWTYTITYFNVPGNPQPWSFYLSTSNGLTQRLSGLMAAPGAPPLALMNIDGGTAVVGQQSAGVIDGGSAAGTPAADIDGGSVSG